MVLAHVCDVAVYGVRWRVYRALSETRIVAISLSIKDLLDCAATSS